MEKENTNISDEELGFYEEDFKVNHKHQYSSTLSIQGFGILIGLLTAIFGLFIVFAWKHEEDRKQYLFGWLKGVGFSICIAIILVLFISCSELI